MENFYSEATLAETSAESSYASPPAVKRLVNFPYSNHCSVAPEKEAVIASLAVKPMGDRYGLGAFRGDVLVSVTFPHPDPRQSARLVTVRRVFFDEMFSRAVKDISMYDAPVKRMSFFAGQVSLELIRDGGRHLKSLINYVAGITIVDGEVDLHEDKHTAAAAYHHPRHTGCATISVLTTQTIAERVLKALNEKSFTTDQHSVWISDSEGLDKNVADQLQRYAGVDRRQFRAQRMVFEFSKKQKKSQGQASAQFPLVHMTHPSSW